MIADGGKGIRKSVKYAHVTMIYHRGLTVHYRLRLPDGCAIAVPDTLVPQADTQQGHSGTEMPYDVIRDACVLGSRGSGRDNDIPRLHFFNLVYGGLIIALDHNLLTQFAQVLKQVIGETIIVIN